MNDKSDFNAIKDFFDWQGSDMSHVSNALLFLGLTRTLREADEEERERILSRMNEENTKIAMKKMSG